MSFDDEKAKGRLVSEWGYQTYIVSQLSYTNTKYRQHSDDPDIYYRTLGKSVVWVVDDDDDYYAPLGTSGHQKFIKPLSSSEYGFEYYQHYSDLVVIAVDPTKELLYKNHGNYVEQPTSIYVVDTDTRKIIASVSNTYFESDKVTLVDNNLVVRYALDKEGSQYTNFIIRTITLFSDRDDYVYFDSLDDAQTAHAKKAGGGSARYDAGKGNDFVTLPDKDVAVPGGYNEGNWFRGGEGNDWIEGGNRNDRIDGGPGDDSLHASRGVDLLNGGAGNDSFWVEPDNFWVQGGGVEVQTFHGGTETPGPSDLLIDRGDFISFGERAANDYVVTVQFNPSKVTWQDTVVTVQARNKKENIYKLIDVEHIAFDDVTNNKVMSGKTALGASGIPGEMLRLAVEVYGKLPTLEHKAEPLAYEKGYDDSVANAAVARGWHAVSALELGIKPADYGEYGTLKYSFVNGFYAARDTAMVGWFGKKASDVAQVGAMVLTGVINGKRTLSITFRGTDQVADADDYSDFDQHYAKFKPLFETLLSFIEYESFQQVLVGGHSLGGAMVQTFLSEHPDTKGNWNVKYIGITAGSPGSDAGMSDTRITNFINTDDPVPLAPYAKPAITALAASLAIGGAAAAVKYLKKALLLTDKDRAGSDIEFDSGTATGLNIDEHKNTLYVSNVLKLMAFATDTDSPFSKSKAAQKLATGQVYKGKDIKIGVGAPLDPGKIVSASSAVIKAPDRDDDFVLGSGGDDVFVLTMKTLTQKSGDRIFDGGLEKEGDTVQLPFKMKRGVDGKVYKMVEHKGGDAWTLKYDPVTGPRDKWATIGTFYRVETVEFADGKTKSLAKAAGDHDGDLLMA